MGNNGCTSVYDMMLVATDRRVIASQQCTHQPPHVDEPSPLALVFVLMAEGGGEGWEKGRVD